MDYEYCFLEEDLAMNNRSGFTLPELLVAAVVFVLTFVGIIYSFIKGMELNEVSQNTSMALAASKNRMEAVRNTPFNQIYNTFNNVTFTAANLTGIGITYVDNSNPDLFQVKTVFCWRQKNGLIYGEDTNLNGVLNTGEDANGNNQIDSPVSLVSYVYNE